MWRFGWNSLSTQPPSGYILLAFPSVFWHRPKRQIFKWDRIHPEILYLDLYQTQKSHWHCVVLQSKKDLHLLQLHNVCSRLILIWRNENWLTPQHHGLYFLQAPVTTASLLLMYFVVLMQEEGHIFWGVTELGCFLGVLGVGFFFLVWGGFFWDFGFGLFGGFWGAFSVLFLLSHIFVTKNQGFFFFCTWNIAVLVMHNECFQRTEFKFNYTGLIWFNGKFAA